MGKYCMYLRKSRADAEAEARGEGETLARHEKLLLETAKRGKYNITKIYREVVSGETIAARPEMQKLLLEVEQNIWTGVLVVEVERLARGDTIDQGIVAQAFKYSDTKIITPMKVYDPNNEFDEEYFEFGLFMSRREYKTINRRLQRGRAASAKEGKYVGSKSPYGYERVRIDGDKGYTLKQIPEQADIVRLIYEWYTHGESQLDGSFRRIGTTLIAKKLNTMKIPTKNGGAWTANNVRSILINPVYTGKIRWNFRSSVKKMDHGEITKSRPTAKNGDYILVEGLHQAIISEDVFKTAQAFFHANIVASIPTNMPMQNPLSGIVCCSKCNHIMVRRPYGNRNKSDTLICKTLECANVSSELQLVENKILSGLADWLHEYRLQWETQEKIDNTDTLILLKQNALQKIDAELKTLNQQLEKTYDLLEQGIYDTDTFRTRSQSITNRISDAKKQRHAMDLELTVEEKRKESMTQIIPKVERLLEVYHGLTTAQEKNDMLKSVLEKVSYTKEYGTRWHGSPDDFDVVLYPRIPK